MSEQNNLIDAINSYKKNADPNIVRLIKDLPLEEQLTALKGNSQANRVKEPLEEYMTYDQANDKIEFKIPASVLMNSKNNKKLLGIE